jgi:hypothetical protein
VPTVLDDATRARLIESSVGDLSESRANKKALGIALNDQSSANLALITLLSLLLQVPAF